MTSDIQVCCIGDLGQAKSPLAPSGIVEINGKQFSARAVGGAIDAGSAIVVTAGDVGGLVVRAHHPDFAIDQLPQFGQPAYDSFGDKAKAKAAREQEERRQELESWLKTARKREWQIGSGFGALSVWLLNPVLIGAELGLPSRVAYGLAFFAVALVWAIGVFRSIDHVVRQFDEEFIRLISISTVLALAGSAFGLWSMESLGIAIGLGLAIIGAIAGAFVIPLVSTLFLGDGP